MLYLISPTAPLQWCNMPARSTMELAREHGADLARLEWQPAERPYDTDLVRLAPRHGHPCSAGIVVDAGDVYTLGHAELIRRSQADVEQAQENLRANNELMERLIPGWTEHGRELDARIARSSEDAAARADREAEELLAGEPNPDLVSHWRGLGGQPVA